ncbi:MAG: TrkA C-terminal domain-containing protein [Planctomycetota bacterium]
MAAVFSLLIALGISLIVTRIAALALMFTGLSREAARFQARSAFSGCGYTTREAENVVNHPVRRRIVMALMLLGNIGIATVVATVILSFSSANDADDVSSRLVILGILTFGILLLFVLFSSRWVERQMNKVIALALHAFTDLEIRDYQALLQLADGYAVSEMIIENNHWLDGSILRDIRLADEGILILGIHRTKDYQGIPRANDQILAGDTLILYGKLEYISMLDQRRSGKTGDNEHAEQVQKYAALKKQNSDH